MKKGLLIWNVVVTIVALVLIFTACTSDSRVDWCVQQITAQQVTINNLQNDVNALKSANSQLLVLVQQHENRLSSLESTLLQVVARMNAQ